MVADDTAPLNPYTRDSQFNASKYYEQNWNKYYENYNPGNKTNISRVVELVVSIRIPKNINLQFSF